MEDYVVELDRIRGDLAAGKTIEPTTIRAFLSWFDMYRRTKWNRDFIDKELEKRNLLTVPDYKEAWVDLPMTFAFKPATGSLSIQLDGERLDGTATTSDAVKDRFGDDPSFKIGKLDAASRPPLWAAPTASLTEIRQRCLQTISLKFPLCKINMFSKELSVGNQSAFELLTVKLGTLPKILWFQLKRSWPPRPYLMS